MQTATIAEKHRKQAISGRFWAKRTYRGRIKDDHKIDPCMGSGHILIYMFDVLLQIYQNYGYSARDAAQCIVKKNLWGLDIDERAAQLAYFSVMMKARQYDRRFFKRNIQPNVFSIAESNAVPQASIDYFAGDNVNLKDAMMSIVTDLKDAKEYGSIIHVTPVDFNTVDVRLSELKEDNNFIGTNAYQELLPLVNTAKALSQKYHVVVTNPPYMGGSGMNPKLNKYVKDNYPDSKSDLFAVFIEKCASLAKENNYVSMITQQAWMFLSSYEKLRTKILHSQMVNMVHLGSRAFDEIGGEVVQTTSFVLRRNKSNDCLGTYCRLITPTTQQGKEDMFLSGENRYIALQDNFSKIPGSPIAYWASDNIIKAFRGKKLFDHGRTCQGFATGDNNRFLRLWFEPSDTSIFWNCSSHEQSQDTSLKWYPCTKGGAFRRWYGNMEYLVNWQYDGKELNGFRGSVIRNPDFYFRKAPS